MIVLRTFCLLGFLIAAAPVRAEAPRVLASIAPIHSLVASVMEGVGDPDLLVPGSVSEHDYALKPSDLRKIASADLVVWVGEPLETYLAKPLITEDVDSLELLQAPGVDPRPFDAEAPGQERAESEDSDAHGHEHLGLDPHIWLDPRRAQRIVEAVAGALVERDPGNAERYRRNTERTLAELQALEAEIRARLAPVAGKPFITFHDGYSYFVERFGLKQVGQLTVDPERRQGAATISALREQIRAGRVACIFTEPQFDPGMLEGLAGEAQVKVGVLDAVGAGIKPGPDLYATLFRSNAAAVESCLSPIG